MRLKLLARACLPVGAVLLSTSALFAQGGIAREGNPFQSWNDKTIMIFSPHPDDEIIGPLLLQWRTRLGQRCGPYTFLRKGSPPLESRTSSTSIPLSPI